MKYNIFKKIFHLNSETLLKRQKIMCCTGLNVHVVYVTV